MLRGGPHDALCVKDGERGVTHQLTSTTSPPATPSSSCLAAELAVPMSSPGEVVSAGVALNSGDSGPSSSLLLVVGPAAITAALGPVSASVTWLRITLTLPWLLGVLSEAKPVTPES